MTYTWNDWDIWIDTVAAKELSDIIIATAKAFAAELKGIPNSIYPLTGILECDENNHPGIEMYWKLNDTAVIVEISDYEFYWWVSTNYDSKEANLKGGNLSNIFELIPILKEKFNEQTKSS